MEKTKYDYGNDTTVTNQQALVKKSIGKSRKRVIKDIPGGATMFNKDSDGAITREEDLIDAVYTWLRHVRFFKEVKISFVKQDVEIDTNNKTILDFDQTTNGRPVWEVQSGRKRQLAELIATQMWRMQNVAYVTISPESVVVSVATDKSFGPTSESWGPHLDFLPNYKAKGEYAIYRE